jgi:polysaccharide chain length determinant protein (PEP-CTERM system associated)
MLPGKKYKPEDFVGIVWRYKWVIIAPTVLAALGTFVWAQTLPDRYKSSTTILVVPQRVPESYVRSTVTAGVAERLQTISQQILSRTRLERIIEEFNLYRDERKTMITEDIVELMRHRDIKVEVATPRRDEDSTHFTVGFESSNPRMAMQVADRLSQMFVQENLEDRAVLADATNQFLQAQLEDSKRRLLEHEAKLEEFKQRNAGQLPTQVQSNLQMMQVTQSQIQANSEAATREQNQLTVLENTIADAVAGVDQPLGAARQAPVTSVDQAPTGTLAQQLEGARALLQNLEQARRLKPTHPDVVRVKRIITDLEARVAADPRPGAPTTAAPGALPPALAAKVGEMRVQSEQLRKSLEGRKAEDERLKRVLGSYMSRIDVAPKLESELTELMRDYDTLQSQYTALLRKAEESKIAVNLERRQIGEQFKIIDGARLPERPVSPDRVRLNAMGVIGGLAFGLALVILLEYRDTSLKNDDDVVVSLALPVLAVIPAMVTAADQRRMKRRRIVVACCAASLLVAGAAVAVAWQLRMLPDWIR